mmetsp:Transcript_2182/g.5051  ORF Transcript_2182/g.5051 Transcript_2182/m.5051 type:complete len:146 (+) Transcript_2182:798-1235(+)
MQSSAVMDAHTAVPGVQVMDVPSAAGRRAKISIAEAESYANTLQKHEQHDMRGCYSIHCSCCGSGPWLPCCWTYNLMIGNCFWSVTPCCLCTLFNYMFPDGPGFMNLKGDSHMLTVDAQRKTLACFFGRGRRACLCCYCEKSPLC